MAKRALSQIFLWEDQADWHVNIPPKKLIAFGWYGGKYSHLKWLLPLLPKCHHYCEPFGGSAAVLLNRETSPVETYNDLDGDVTNFFRVLRNQKEALIEAIGLTPFSREELYYAVMKNSGPISDMERARRFFVRARQARTGLAQTASLGRWANCKNTSRGECPAWFHGGSAASKIYRTSRRAFCGCKLKTGPRLKWSNCTTTSKRFSIVTRPTFTKAEGTKKHIALR